MPSNTKVLIVGWDGATWDLARPWIESGDLPHLAKLVERGASGELLSTEPPMTFPAWSTFLTGREPGGHGIYDFTEKLPGRYSVRLINARARKAPTIWKLLSDAGRKVCSIAVPVTYPPEPVNGAMISGFDAPGTGASADPSSMYPPELFEEIQQNVGDYIIASHIAPLVDAGKHEEALDRVLHTVDRKGEAASYLLKKGEWDAFMILFGESDLAGHHYWRFHDENSPFYDRESDRVHGSLKEIYRRLDRWTGRLIEEAGKDATVVILSDHGFGPAGDRVVRLNAWLAEQGWLQFRRTGGTGIQAKLFGMAKKAGLRVLPAPIKRFLLRKAGSLVGAVESGLRFGRIDLPATKAFSEETPHFPAIWINVADREAAGCVRAGSEYEQLRDRILGALCEWQDPETGQPIVADAWRREDLYHGPCVEAAPDIVLKWNLDPAGMTYQNGISKGEPGEKPVDRVDVTDPSWRLNKSGSHRPEGIVALAGHSLVPGTLEGANIKDLAPTILYLLGVPVPKEMDGRVLEQAFVPSHLDRFPPRYEAGTSESSSRDEEAYSADEEEVIAERLRGMGYLE